MSEQLLDASWVAPDIATAATLASGADTTYGSCASDAVHSVALELQAASRLFFVLMGAWVQLGDDAHPPLRRGQCQWRATTPEGMCVTLGFEWLESRSGVLCLADPMCVRSNLKVLRDGEPISDAEQHLMLANCVYRLNWQALVLEHLRPPQLDPPQVDVSSQR